MEILGIDVGGTGIKAAIVDVKTGQLVSDRKRIETPAPSTPDSIAAAVGELAADFEYAGVVGCSFPAVIIGGQTKTAGNLDSSWRGMKADELFSSATGCRFHLLNDADAAGIAEMQLGAGQGLMGMVITITIGTGLGSGVFYDGRLIPNIELGRIFGKDGEPIEFYAGDRARKRDNLGWEEWGERFNFFLAHVKRIFSPQHFIIGGGASKNLHKFESSITVDVPLRVAAFRNNAGIIGAAIEAARST